MKNEKEEKPLDQSALGFFLGFIVGTFLGIVLNAKWVLKLRVNFIGYVRRVGGMEMNKREFNNVMDYVIKKLSDSGGCNWTCHLIGFHFGDSVFHKYDEFIRPFLTYGIIKNKHLMDRPELRLYLLEQFRDHCLRTGIYKEF